MNADDSVEADSTGWLAGWLGREDVGDGGGRSVLLLGSVAKESEVVGMREGK